MVNKHGRNAVHVRPSASCCVSQYWNQNCVYLFIKDQDIFFLAKRMREGTIHIPNLSHTRRSGDFGRLKNYVRSRIWLSIDDQDTSLTRMKKQAVILLRPIISSATNFSGWLDHVQIPRVPSCVHLTCGLAASFWSLNGQSAPSWSS